jgi:hypothetical protein
MSLATPSCVQKLQTASHGTSCVFSESRMREICLSGSMSGNRKQNQAKPDCWDLAKAKSNITERLPLLRLFSTLLPIALI